MWLFLSIFSCFALFQIFSKKIISFITLLGFFFLLSIAFYQSTIELGYINNIFSCTSSSGLNATNIEELGEIIMNTETVLISNKKTRHTGVIAKIKKRFEGYQLAMKYDMMLYNISGTNLEAAKKITPGIKAPTVMALSAVNDEDKWYAIQVMVLKKKTSQMMDDLTDLGATGILVMEIKNCRT